MKKIIRRLKKTRPIIRYIYYILILAYLISFIFFAKSIIGLTGIETLLRYIVLFLFIVYWLLYIMWNLINIVSRKAKPFILTSLLTLVFIVLFSVGSYFINFVYQSIDAMGENENVEYKTYLITLSGTEFNEDSKIGRVNNKDDVIYTLSEKLYSKEKLSNTIEDYEDSLFMLKELYDGKIDAAFVPSTYVILYRNEEGLEDLEYKTKMVYEYSETMKNQDALIVSDKDFSEPLTFLVMGVDSEINGLNANAAFNGDTLMLVSFNPDTLKTTMVSIPRDTYVPIACRKNAYAKINSAAAGGTSCVLDTVGNFLDVKIDYYAKINFKGVVELVDAIGGVDVDVEAPDFKKHGGLGINCDGKFCEQNSSRKAGKDVIYLDPGFQTLNGEEALAYSRCRYLYAGGDLDRIYHQQQVVEALASKMLSFDSISDFQKILTAVSNNMVTNMDRSKITSGYSVIKKMLNNALSGNDVLTINKAHLETYGLSVYVPSQQMNTSAQGYYKDSLEDIQRALKETLGLEKEEVIKTFHFSVNEEYVVTSPGTGLKKNPSASTLPSFVGKPVDEAQKWCGEHKIDLSIKYVDPGSEFYNSSVAVGLIGSQSVHANSLLSTVDSLTVYIVNSAASSTKPNDSDDEKNDEKNNTNKNDKNDKNDKKDTENKQPDDSKNDRKPNKSDDVDDMIMDLLN
ncbi:MAG: LCP family protein [Bacilli bacterium]|nr:LCP family protein [Bacilli bacterium]